MVWGQCWFQVPISEVLSTLNEYDFQQWEVEHGTLSEKGKRELPREEKERKLGSVI